MIPRGQTRRGFIGCWRSNRARRTKNNQRNGERENHSPQRSANFTAQSAFTPLRLIRVRIGGLKLGDLPVGQWRILSAKERALVVKGGIGLRPVR
jgi:hypothetical protein